MAIAGYARVSSVGQSPDVQLDKLKTAAKSFRRRKVPPEENVPHCRRVWNMSEKDDTLIVTRLDRLARSTLHLCQIADELKRKGVELLVLDQHINTADATGRLLFNMLGAINQFETKIRSERQIDGINKAKQKGVKFGAARKLTAHQIEELREKRQTGVSIKNLMAEYKLSKASVYRYLEGQTKMTASDRTV